MMEIKSSSISNNEKVTNILQAKSDKIKIENNLNGAFNSFNANL